MDKEKVLELAREGGLVHQWQTQGEQHDILKTLERFADLIEREVRGDAEPVAWIRKTDITEMTDAEPETDGWIPLYTHPTPAVVRQLVEAVERLRQKAKWINDEQAVVPYDEMLEVKTALAAVKEAWL